MHLIPESSSHWHILLSVVPSVGLIFLLGFYVAAIVTNNEGMKRTCLVFFFLLALVAIPTYWSGDRSMTDLASDAKISQDLMSYHYGWGITALALLGLTGVVALIA